MHGEDQSGKTQGMLGIAAEHAGMGVTLINPQPTLFSISAHSLGRQHWGRGISQEKRVVITLTPINVAFNYTVHFSYFFQPMSSLVKVPWNQNCCLLKEKGRLAEITLLLLLPPSDFRRVSLTLHH